MTRLLPLLLALPLVATAGCRSPRSTEQPQPPVQLRAYINVTSGCQQETVDFIKSLAAKYPRLNVELIDFGDGGAGGQRWESSGHKCMTLEINGQPTVKYPFEGKMKAVAFRMPQGLLWSHADLEQAVQAAMDGKLQPATDEEAEAAPTQINDRMQELKAKRDSHLGKPGAAEMPTSPAPGGSEKKSDLKEQK